MQKSSSIAVRPETVKKSAVSRRGSYGQPSDGDARRSGPEGGLVHSPAAAGV